ncbi:hypothetical protein BDD12DRAFT_725665, partial [Trichophaea hybrida]
IGAGIVGAALAQALRKNSISFEIFERDPHVDARGQGWGMTLHWALPTLYSILPPHQHPLILAAQVDISCSGNEEVEMLTLDASTAKTNHIIMPTKRVRVKRERLRKAMLHDLPVQWNKRLLSITTTDEGVTVAFEDGTTATGTLVVGADGSASQTRRILAPETHALKPLPIHAIGAEVNYTPEQMAPMLKLDPLLFQAIHPETNDFLWWSILDTPQTSGNGCYLVQVSISYDLRKPGNNEVPASNAERIADMKKRAVHFASPLREAVLAIPDDNVASDVRLADWDLVSWPNNKGRATLVGDAAHAMTMYRGDAANHGIMDAANLAATLKRVTEGEISLEDAVMAYEEEVRGRCRPAVWASRQACLDAHNWERLGEDSPLIERRMDARFVWEDDHMNGRMTRQNGL